MVCKVVGNFNLLFQITSEKTIADNVFIRLSSSENLMVRLDFKLQIKMLNKESKI